jgi:hypothetical protein
MIHAAKPTPRIDVPFPEELTGSRVVLIGGDGADAPISEDTAEELARALLEWGVSAILQLNDLGLSGQRRVIARFLTGLMKAPRPLWHPVLVTLDEAHRYAPQNGVVESRTRQTAK